MSTIMCELAPRGESRERRQWPRMKVPVLTELKPKGSEVPIRVKTSDLSVGGCYVEMMFTLEIGTALDITLWLDDSKLITTGKVVTRHVQFGNGIEFLDMGVAVQLRLDRFLKSSDGKLVQ